MQNLNNKINNFFSNIDALASLIFRFGVGIAFIIHGLGKFPLPPQGLIEYFDLSPFISEIIIEKMDINFVCSQKCKGLCSFCGINKNNLSCNHNEKNSKESPFSSLSQLDL